MNDLSPLNKRTTEFSKSVIVLCKKIRQDSINRPLISQLVRSGTSIGANYHEANGASSAKDFKNKIYIAKKEAMETQYWLEVISQSNPDLSSEVDVIKNEAIELGKILSKIIGTMNTKTKN